MNAHLLIDAEVPPTGGTLLLEVAMGLREHRLRPSSMVWSVIAGQDHGKLMVELPPDREHQLPALVERLRGIPEVRSIVMHERTPFTIDPKPSFSD